MRNRFRALGISTGLFRRVGLAALALIVVLSGLALFNRPKAVLGQTYGLTQDDWSGGATANDVDAPSNLTGWDEYSSSSGVTAGAGSVALPSNQDNFGETFTSTSYKDAANTTATWSTSGELSVPVPTNDDFTAALYGLTENQLLTTCAYYQPGGAIYCAANNKFIKYDIASATAVDLTTTSGLNAFWSYYAIYTIAIDASGGKIYLGGDHGNFAVYTPGDPGTAVNLATDSGFSAFWSTTKIKKAVFNTNNSKLYLLGESGKFAVYTPGSPGTAVDLATDSGLSAFWTTGAGYSMTFNSTNGYVYLGGQDGRFAVYVPGSPGTATNLAVDSGLTALWGGQHLLSMEFDASQTLYLGGTCNRFAAYTPGTPGSVADISVTSGLNSYWGCVSVYGLAYVASASKLYVSSGYGRFAEYDSGTGIATDLSSGLDTTTIFSYPGAAYLYVIEDIGNSEIYIYGTTSKVKFYKFTPGSPGTLTDFTPALAGIAFDGQKIEGAAYDPVGGLIYYSSYGGRFASYNPSTAEIKILTYSSGLASWWGSATRMYAMYFDTPSRKLYFAGGGSTANSRFGVYDPVTGIATNLTVTCGLSAQWGNNIRAIAWDADNSIMYLGGESGKLASYSVSTGNCTDHTTASGFSAFWGSSHIYALAYDSVGGKLYIGGADRKFASYAPGNPGAATNLTDTSGLSSYWASNTSTVAMTFDPINGKIYLGASGGRFASYTPGDPGTVTYLSVTSGLSSFTNHNIYFLGYDSVNDIIDIVFIDITARSKFAVYTPGDPGTAVSMTEYVSGSDWTTGTYAATIDQASGNLYYGGNTAFSGRLILPCMACNAVSTATDSTTQNIYSATLTKNDTPGTGTVSYRLSNDGGSTYESVTPGVPHDFSSTGSDLRFKITLTGDATVQDVSIAYDYYTASGTLTSSKFDSGDANNIFNLIEWDEDASLPSGTSVTVSVRTADTSTNLTGAWTDLTNASSNCSKVGTTVTCGATALPAGMQDGSNDRWFQYKVALSSTGAATPEVSSVAMQFVVNAAPEVRNVSALQNGDGTVTISYEVRDIDTQYGSPGNQDHITPSFEYWDGSAYQPITALAAGDTDEKAVAHDGSWNNVTYTATWTPKTDYDGYFQNNTAKVRVTANDGEGANPTGSAESSTYTLDTKAPTGASLTVDASGASPVANLSAADDSTLYMKVSKTDPTLASTGVEAYSTTRGLPLDSGDTVYVQFIDAYSNATAILSATVPTTPDAVIIQDTSNMISTPPAYQLFIAWKASSAPDFASYKLYRSASPVDPYPWTLLTTITSQSTNYYLDQGLSEDDSFSYYVVTADTAGGYSNRSSVVTGTANGTQDGNEGGGGISGPTISNVSSGTPGTTTATITWNTDTLSDSAVDYGLVAGSYGSSASDASLADNASGVGPHSVTLSGLTPATTYYFRARSTDLENNADTDDNGGSSYSFETAADAAAPVISAVSVELVNETSAVISWTTDELADTRVGYSTDLSYAGTATVGGFDTSHLITLSGLTGDTTYYFRVMSADPYSNSALDDNGGAGYTFTTTAGTVIIRSRPPETDTIAPNILNLKVTSIGKTSAIVEWNTDEAADTVVKYGPTTAYGSLAGSVDEKLMAHQVNLIELKPGTVYHLIAVSSDAAGNQGISSDRQFATLNPDGTQVPLPPEPEETPPAAPEQGTEEPAAPEQGTEEPAAPETAPDIGPTDRLMGALTDLLNDPDLSGLPEQPFVSTVTEIISRVVKPPSIVGLAPNVEVSGTNAVVSWLTDKKATSVVAYASADDYRPTEDNPYAEAVIDPEDFSLAHVVELIGLEPGTEYHFQVRSKGLVGGEAKSADMTFRTASELPVIEGLRVAELSERTALLVWTTNVPTSTEVVFKNVATGQELTQGDTAFLRDHGFRLENLEAGAAYSLVVRAKDESGNLVGSRPLSLSTAKDENPPEIIKVTSDSTLYPGQKTRVQTIVSWDTDEPATSQVFYQEGLGKDAPEVEVPFDPTLVKNHTVVITKFRPMTVYKFHVESSDAAGNLSKSNDFLVLTPHYKASILDIIIENLEQVFGWTKKIR